MENETQNVTRVRMFLALAVMIPVTYAATTWMLVKQFVKICKGDFSETTVWGDS